MTYPGKVSLLATASLILATSLLSACLSSEQVTKPGQDDTRTSSVEAAPKTSSLPGEEEAAKLQALVAEVIPVLPGSPSAQIKEVPACFIPRIAKAYQDLEAFRSQAALAQGKKMLLDPQQSLDPSEPTPGLEPLPASSTGTDNNRPLLAAPLPAPKTFQKEVTLTDRPEPIQAGALAAQNQASVTDLTAEEIRLAQNCITPYQQALFAQSPHGTIRHFGHWRSASDSAYFSEAVGGRYVNVHLNPLAGGEENSLYQDRRKAIGATLAVPSFTVAPTGQVHNGPLVLLEKMDKGFETLHGNWRYTIVGTDGDLKAVTGGRRSDGVDLCKNCPPDAADRLYDAMRTAKEIGGSQP